HYVSRSAISKELEATILVLHTMYGVNELDMQRYVLEASDINTGMIDERKLKNNVYRDYHARAQKKVQLHDVVEKDIQNEQKQQRNRKSVLKQQELTENEITIVEVSEEISPFD